MSQRVRSLRHGKERSGAFDAPLSSEFASTSPLVGLSCYATKVASHIKPPPTRTILMSNDSSSSSHLLNGEGETVWKRERWRENRDTRKDERYPVVLGGFASRDH